MFTVNISTKIFFDFKHNKILLIIRRQS